MIVKFDKEYLSELYAIGKCSDKKHRFQPQIISRFKRCIDTLIGASDIESLYAMVSLHYKVLSGNKNGISSIRINGQYRIEFTVEKIMDEPIITICTIIDISNHYE